MGITLARRNPLVKSTGKRITNLALLEPPAIPPTMKMRQRSRDVEMKSSHASAGGRVGTGEIGSLTQLNLRQDLPAPQNYAAMATTSFRQAASRVEIGYRIRCVSTEKVPGSQRAVPGQAGERQIVIEGPSGRGD
jgi:hypothetical protein